jgi:hypothetical protein
MFVCEVRAATNMSIPHQFARIILKNNELKPEATTHANQYSKTTAIGIGAGIATLNYSSLNILSHFPYLKKNPKKP